MPPFAYHSDSCSAGRSCSPEPDHDGLGGSRLREKWTGFQTCVHFFRDQHRQVKMKLRGRFPRKGACPLSCNLHMRCPPTPLNFSTKAAIFWNSLRFVVRYCGLSGLILGRMALSSVPLSLANSLLSEVAIYRLAASESRFSSPISAALLAGYAKPF